MSRGKQLVSKMRHILRGNTLPSTGTRFIIIHERGMFRGDPPVKEYVLYKKVHNQWIVEKHELNGVII